MKEFKKIQEVKGQKFLFQVETSRDHRDYQKYEKLRNEIWEEPADNLAGTRNMLCENYFHDGGSLFLSVFSEEEKECFKRDDEHLVGFSYGFVGVKNKKLGFRALDNLQFYSQYTGIKQGFQHLGLGILIKDFQREVVKGLFGILTVTCTFDPLTGVNAYRNIHHFGMDVIEYKEAYYGEFGGLLNRRDVPCDRFFVCWDLEKKVHRPEYDIETLLDSGYSVITTDYSEVNGKSGPFEFEVIKQTRLEFNHEFLLVEIPLDFYRMLRETDVSESPVRRIPLEWRMETRKVFQNLFQRKYRINDFRQVKRGERKRNYYVLHR